MRLFDKPQNRIIHFKHGVDVKPQPRSGHLSFHIIEWNCFTRPSGQPKPMSNKCQHFTYTVNFSYQVIFHQD